MITNDAHTGFLVDDSLCTGCGMCLIACASIKQQVFSFSGEHAYLEVVERRDGHATRFEVAFTGDCDGCTYCLEFCGYDAIGKPDGWTPAAHLREIRKRHQRERRDEVARDQDA